MNPVVDSHQHFWDRSQPEPFDYSWQDPEELLPIRRTFLPDDLRPLLDKAGVDYTVFVQAQHHVEETRWALGLTEQHPWIKGVVGWVDLASPDVEDQLIEFKDHPHFTGIRHVTQDEPDDDFIVRDDIIRGLKVLEKLGVPFDLLFYTKHLRHAPTLAGRLPDLPMVIDHLSKPEIRLGKVDSWKRDLAAAAQHENIFCKLSGMITEADWRSWEPAHLKPYVQAALDLFGPERLMFGSDWPVSTLAGTYQQVVMALNDALGDLSDDERDMIYSRTATRFYNLNV